MGTVNFSLLLAILRTSLPLSGFNEFGRFVLRACQVLLSIQNLTRTKVSVLQVDLGKSNSRPRDLAMGHCEGISSILVTLNRRDRLRQFYRFLSTARFWAVDIFGTVFAYTEGMNAHKKDKSAEEPKANGMNRDVKWPVNVRVGRAVEVAKSNNPVDVTAPHLKVDRMAGARAFPRFTP